MSHELLPCPFCNAAMSIESNRDWHRIVGEHDDRCLFMDRETVTVPATPDQLALAVRDWNRRATQPAAGEPVATVEPMPQGPGYKIVRFHDDLQVLPIGTKLYTVSPAAAHGDEAVRKDTTEEIMQRACAELPEDWYIEVHLENGSGYATLFNDGIVVDFGQDFEGIGAQVEAALDAAMRAQAGEGGEV